MTQNIRRFYEFLSHLSAEMEAQLHTFLDVSFKPPDKELPVPNGGMAGRDSEPVWTRWQREKKSLHLSCRELNASCPARSVVTILTELWEWWSVQVN